AGRPVVAENLIIRVRVPLHVEVVVRAERQSIEVIVCGSRHEHVHERPGGGAGWPLIAKNLFRALADRVQITIGPEPDVAEVAQSSALSVEGTGLARRWEWGSSRIITKDLILFVRGHVDVAAGVERDAAVAAQPALAWGDERLVDLAGPVEPQHGRA